MKQVRPRYYVLTLVPLLVCLFVTGTILWQQGKDSHASIPSTSTPTPTAQRQQFAGYVLDKPTTTRGFTAVDTRLTIPCNTSTATSIPSNAGGPARNALLMYVGIGDNHLEDKEVGIAIQPNGSLGTFVTLLNGTDQFFPGPSSLKCGAQVVAHLEVKGRVAIQSQGNNHNKPLVSPVATKMSYAYQVSWSVSIRLLSE